MFRVWCFVFGAQTGNSPESDSQNERAFLHYYFKSINSLVGLPGPGLPIVRRQRVRRGGGCVGRLLGLGFARGDLLFGPGDEVQRLLVEPDVGVVLDDGAEPHQGGLVMAALVIKLAHAELVAAHGRYWDIYHKQLGLQSGAAQGF